MDNVKGGVGVGVGVVNSLIPGRLIINMDQELRDLFSSIMGLFFLKEINFFIQASNIINSNMKLKILKYLEDDETFKIVVKKSIQNLKI